MTRKSGGVGRSTIRDVAARAGVSASTVSRVLGGVYPVSAAARTRVLRAVREMDYVADARAKAIAGAGTPALAFVLEDITGPAFAHMARGVEREAARLGHLCLVCSTDGDPRHELEFIEMMRAQRAAAVILVGGAADTPAYRERTRRIADSLASAGSRLVLCGRPPLDPGAPVTVIEYDNEGGAHALVTHVLAQGHRRVLFLGGEPDHSTAQGRERGYLAAHRARGLEPDPELLLHGDFTRDCGHRLMRGALEQGLEFTAVVAATDVVAAGALTALHETGLRVPGDVSLAGYDDVPFARDLHPALTTVHVPYEELGRLAVGTALGHGAESADVHLLLGTHVVVRDSVAVVGG
ncbi:LacI family transcriptional regulator [Streptomyces griseochromogenes]|uniref:LacI family transcriptional regulator n=1 Tax=Streptomyces griseochromogenes TaxID=68214 RepID=A0A1B1AUP3_9ACTN|nr:LacI family DNA-binding transcriptional regulator [Streptomyces griseochromogenes]ANP50294.1 LacI family transcriptional regulator [Streptomyces griseochromogenes]MBP2048040.1 LacI family transcriptional regulator [Streptomyces griseochromogenes]